MTPVHLDPHAVILTPRRAREEFLREKVGHILSRYGVSVGIVRSPARSHDLTVIRVEIARALRKDGMTYADIGRHLCRDPWTIRTYVITGGGRAV